MKRAEIVNRLDLGEIHRQRERERAAIKLLTDVVDTDEAPNSSQVRELRKTFDEGNLTGHKGNKVHHTTLRNAFHLVRNGESIRKGSFIQLLYGCGTCPHHNKPTCQYGGESVEGGCPERYLFYRFYLVQSMGDKVPMMEEHLTELKFEAQGLKEHDMKKYGHVSRTWIVLQKLISDIEIAIQRAIEGRLIKVEKNITFNDVRKLFMEVKEGGLNNNGSQGNDNRGRQGENVSEVYSVGSTEGQS